MSVTPLQIASSFLFLGGIEPFFGHQFSMWHSTIMLFLDFGFTPPNAQNLLLKICTKSPISRLVWQIDRKCLGLPGGFRGRPIQWNHAKCCGLTLVAMATKFGLGAEIQSPTGLLLFSIYQVKHFKFIAESAKLSDFEMKLSFHM